MFYEPEINKLWDMKMTDEKIIEYFHLPYINAAYLHVIRINRKRFGKWTRKAFRSNNTKPRPGSNAYEIVQVIEAWGGMEKFMALVKKIGSHAAAREIGRQPDEVRYCIRRWGKKKARWKPRSLGGDPSYKLRRKRQHLVNKPNITALLKMF